MRVWSRGFQRRFRKSLSDRLLVTVIAPCIFASFAWASLAWAQESSHSAGWVVISVEDYRVLRAKAYPADRPPEPPPVDAALSRVDYDLRVENDLAAGSATLTVDVLKDGWVRVPIPVGLLVREAHLDGKLVSLVPGPTEKGSQLSALLSHPGRSVLQLDIDVPVTSSAGEERISLPSTQSGVTRASLHLPRQGIDLKVSGGLLAENSGSAGETDWLAYAHGAEGISFSWRKKVEDHHVDLPLRMRGSLTQLTSLAEDSTAVHAEVNLEIVQGAAHEVRLQLPDKVTINQVLGATIADWEMKNGELAITFLEPVEHSARFVINGETQLPRDGIIEIPQLRLLNAERETGGEAVEILGAGEIKDRKSEGLEDADASDLGEAVASRQSPALAAFRFRSGDAGMKRTLSVNVARYAQQAVLVANVEEARYQVLMSVDGKDLVQARYAIRNNQRNFVKVTLPAGATVWSVALRGKPVRPGQSPDGSLLLPLEKSRGGDDAPAFVVEILYLSKTTAWDDKGKAKFTLPALDLPISRTGLLVYYPPLFRVSAETGAFRPQVYQAPTSTALAPPIISIAMDGPVAGTMGGVIGATGSESLSPAPSGVPNQKAAMPATNRPADADEDKKNETQALLDSFRAKSTGGRVTGILPVSVSFPAFGPSMFLVSELTSENQAPSAEFNFQRDKKASAR